MSVSAPARLAALLAVALAACGESQPAQVSALETPPAVAPEPTPGTPVVPLGGKASCGPGSLPETGLQGRVSRADVDSGRAAQGYTCNIILVGSYIKPNAIGTVGGFKVERYTDKAGHDCAYYDTTLLYPTNAADAQSGVNVLDMRDPAHPVLATQLVTAAMQTPHESLVVATETGVLAAVTGNPGAYPGIVDVYDLEPDCRSPKLRGSSPFGALGHESGISPDGKTFYSASPGSPTLTALDISGLLPTPLVYTSYYSHGLTVGQDGNRAYVAAGNGGGMMILDTSEVQARKSNPVVKTIGSVTWPNMTIPQNAIPFTRDGKPYLLEIDEYSTNGNGGSVAANGSVVGAARIIDIGDETKPKVISDIRLEVHNPEHRAEIANDPGAQLPIQGYAGHYCNLPTRVNPEIVACSMIMSGLRIFDIRDVNHPHEIAYFNAPVQPRMTPVFEASDWAMSSPSFVPERKEIWYTDGYSGFYVVRVTNGVW
jgi:hypothetical protein